jgi:NADH-quinone oxidoreductase subunit C
VSPLSSPESPDSPEGELEDAARLTAEADYAAEHNPPPEEPSSPTAADQGAIAAPGAPGELHSDDEGVTDAPDLGAPGSTVPDGDAGAPPSTGSGAVASGSAGPPSGAPPAAAPDTTTGVQPETLAAEMLAGRVPIPVPAKKAAATVAAAAPSTSVADEPVGADVPAVEVHAEPSQTEAPAPEPAAEVPAPAAAESEPAVPATTAEPAVEAEPAADEPAAVAEPAADEPAAEAEPEPEPEPHDERLSPLLDALRTHLGDGVVETAVLPGKDAWARVTIDAWRQAAEACRDQLGLTYFCFLSAMDWMPSPYGKSEESGLRRAGEIPAAAEGPYDHGVTGGETRFQVLARLERPMASIGLTLKVDIGDDLTIDTWYDLFAGAEWHEREVAEMYGIDFRGHPNQIHIYLPGEFEGFPLRKDYPLLAREVKPWPGLVDVEPMPGEDPEDADASAENPEEVTA